MKVYRTVLVALFTLAMSTGCRTAGVGNFTRPEPLVTGATPAATELVAELNRNAERLQTFEASPTIYVTSPNLNGGVNGHLAMARPRDFKLELATHVYDVADIGSNQDEFWFWAMTRGRNAEKAIYYCKYDDMGNSPLAATLQPDWIVEALGFRTIPEDEAAAITVRPSKDGKTLVLTHPPGKGNSPGRAFRRETVLDAATHRIVQHVVYSPKNEVLAQANIGEYWPDIPAGSDGQGEKVQVPKKLTLEWTQEGMKLDVTLSSPRVNAEISPKRRALLFVEPTKKDHKRVNLAELPNPGVRQPPAAMRSTRPAPPAGVKLGEPSPVGLDDRRSPQDPVALTADLGAGSAPLVTPPLPSAPEPDSIRSATASLREGPPPGFAR